MRLLRFSSFLTTLILLMNFEVSPSSTDFSSSSSRDSRCCIYPGSPWKRSMSSSARKSLAPSANFGTSAVMRSMNPLTNPPSSSSRRFSPDQANVKRIALRWCRAGICMLPVIRFCCIFSTQNCVWFTIGGISGGTSSGGRGISSASREVSTARAFSHFSGGVSPELFRLPSNL